MRRLLCATSLLLFCVAAHAQSTFDIAASAFSGEQPIGVMTSITKAQAIKTFTPILKESTNSAGFVIAAFALAMKGVDVDANLSRLVLPIKDAHDEKIEELTATHGLAKNQILIEDIPNAIYAIYKSRQSTSALKTLLTMPVDWPAAEYRDDCVMTVLRNDPKPVIALASGDAKIYATLWDILDWNVGSMKDRNNFIGRLQTIRWKTVPLKKTAMKLAHDLATPKNRPAK